MRTRAKLVKKEVTLNDILCKGAFEALQRGDANLHDHIVKEAILTLANICDVIILAQASMIRAATTLGELEGKVLTCISLGVAKTLSPLKRLVNE